MNQINNNQNIYKNQFPPRNIPQDYPPQRPNFNNPSNSFNNVNIFPNNNNNNMPYNYYPPPPPPNNGIQGNYQNPQNLGYSHNNGFQQNGYNHY